MIIFYILTLIYLVFLAWPTRRKLDLSISAAIEFMMSIKANSRLSIKTVTYCFGMRRIIRLCMGENGIEQRCRRFLIFSISTNMMEACIVTLEWQLTIKGSGNNYTWSNYHLKCLTAVVAYHVKLTRWYPSNVLTKREESRKLRAARGSGNTSTMIETKQQTTKIA